jgi:LuxR family maltose regulon positive regulatory protein
VLKTDRSRLSPPRQHLSLCTREKLPEYLDALARVRVMLVHAPTGYGKTTLIAQLCEELERRDILHVYYACSERDRDPIKFLSMLSAGLDQIGLASADHTTSDDGALQPEALLEGTLDRLDAAERELLIVVDGYERVEQPEIDRILNSLIANTTPQIRFVLGSRRQPNIGLSALEVRGELYMIDAAGLCLYRNEMASVLELPNDSPELFEIAERTKGWPVAVQLYRLWIQRRGGEAPHNLPEGQIEEVNRYLTEQLFSSLPSEEIDILRDIAAEDEVEASLVDAMRCRNDSAALLEAIATTLSSLMWTSGPIYRLHPLLLHYLREDLARDPIRRSWLAGNASQWYLRHERFSDAIRTAITADRPSLLDDVLRALRPLPLLIAGGAALLRDILRQVPDALLAEKPRLGLMAATAHFKAGFFHEGKAMFDRLAEQTDNFERDPDGSLGSLVPDATVIEMFMICQMNIFTSHIDKLYRKVLDRSVDDPLLWAASENLMILVSQHRGDLEAAKNSLVRARRIYGTVGSRLHANVTIIGQELLVTIAEGGLRQVATLISGYQRGTSLAFGDDLSVPAMIRLASASIRYETDFDEQTLDALQHALEQYGASEALFDHYAITYPPVLLRTLLRDGLEASVHLLADMRARAARVGIEGMSRFLDCLELECRVRAGDLEFASQLIAESGLFEEGGSDSKLVAIAHWREHDAIAQAMCLYWQAQGNLDNAVRVAQQMVEAGVRGGRLRTRIKGLTLLALALAQQDQSTASLNTLHEAILLAYPEGFVAPFAEERQAISPLLEALDAGGDLDVYARRHIAAIQKAIASTFSRPDLGGLNEREREILQHLAEGASNKLIARRLGVTDNTIKFHLKKLFAKLNVSTRRAAVAKAAEHTR